MFQYEVSVTVFDPKPKTHVFVKEASNTINAIIQSLNDLKAYYTGSYEAVITYAKPTPLNKRKHGNTNSSQEVLAHS